MNRRDLLKGLMAGGVMTAAGLWIPGQKMISIPSGKQFYGPSIFEIMGNNIRYIGPEYETVTIKKFYSWLARHASKALAPMQADTPNMVSLASGYRIENPEHLTEGTLAQDRTKSPLEQQCSQSTQQREYWSCVNSLGDDVIVADKVYEPDYYSTAYTPRERIREDEDGLKGWR